MTGADLLAAAGAALASLAVALRSIMLKPDLPSWCNGPLSVRLALMLAASVWGGLALSILRFGHTSPREALGVLTNASLALVLLLNLWRQRDCGKGRVL